MLARFKLAENTIRVRNFGIKI